MTLHIGIGGAWKEVQPGTAIGVGGANKTIETVHIGVGGAWKQFFQNQVFTLSGTTGTPNVAEFADTPGPVSAGWRFGTAGDVYKNENGSFGQFQAGVEYSNVNPPGTLYFRATSNSGANPSTGPTLNTWVDNSTARDWTWTKTSSSGSTVGSIKVELATDSGGTDIVATGYYGGDATIL